MWTSELSWLSADFLMDRGVETNFLVDRKGVRPTAIAGEHAVGILGLKTVGKAGAVMVFIALIEGGERGAESARPRAFLAAERLCVGDILQSSALRGLQNCERLWASMLKLHGHMLEHLPTDSPRRDELDRVARVVVVNACVGFDFSEREERLLIAEYRPSCAKAGEKAILIT